MRREGMLYRYLRDYTPNSPMNSPLDAIPYDLDPEDEILDSQPAWWGDLSTQPNPSSSRRDSSPSVDPMDTSTPSSQRGLSVPPISIPIPESANRRSSTTASLAGSETMAVSPIQTIMPPPMVPQVARMKRKGIPTWKEGYTNNSGLWTWCSDGD